MIRVKNDCDCDCDSEYGIILFVKIRFIEQLSIRVNIINNYKRNSLNYFITT